MKIEIRAGYAATDGSMPEEVSVEVADIDGHYDQAITAVMPILDKLLTAPSLGRQVWSAVAGRGPALDPRDLADPGGARCRRYVCGHSREDHDDPLHEGACGICLSLDKCRSFVGKGPVS